MTRAWTVRCAGALLLAALAGAARAAAPGESGQPETPIFRDVDPYEKLERKEPSLWRRPAEETPAAQLARARRFEQEGRRSHAISACDSLVHKWHNAPEAVLAQQALARLLEEDGQYERAFREHQYLIVYFAGQFPYLDALERQFREANALRGEGRTFLGITIESLDGVRRMYERILLNGPRWSRAPEVALAIGAVREAADETTEAVAAYEAAANRYPGTAAARDASWRGAMCRQQLAQRHPRDESLRVHAITALAAFERAYPDDPRVPEAARLRAALERSQMTSAYEQALFYDRSRKDRAAAVQAYRAFLLRYPDAPQRAEVEARLRKLEAPAGPAGQGETP
jgi:tetratricopeptide (TPR) repeat protein